MRTREQFFLTVFFFLFLSILLFFLGRTTFFSFGAGLLESILHPFQNAAHTISNIPQKLFTNAELVSLRAENIALQKKLIDQETLKKENNALKDQFATVRPKSQNLLPAKIIGSPGFLPGVTLPNFYILSVGLEDGVKLGQAAVMQDNIVGKVTKVSQKSSVVTILTDASLSFAGEILDGTLGVIKGQNDETLLFDNVLTSKTLHVGDVVVTKGDINEGGIGYPPNLVVGKITSIDKTQSNLFQTAQIKSALHFETLDMVFLVIAQ